MAYILQCWPSVHVFKWGSVTEKGGGYPPLISDIKTFLCPKSVGLNIKEFLHGSPVGFLALPVAGTVTSLIFWKRSHGLCTLIEVLTSFFDL